MSVRGLGFFALGGTLLALTADLGLAQFGQVAIHSEGMAIAYSLLLFASLLLTAGGLLGWIALLPSPGRPIKLPIIILAMLGPAILAWLLKVLIGRARPRHEPWNPILFEPMTFADTFASFPSMQATLSGAVAFDLGLIVPRLQWALLSVGVAICLSRIGAGAHWISDVVAGWVIGTSGVSVLARLHSSRVPRRTRD